MPLVKDRKSSQDRAQAGQILGGGGPLPPQTPLGSADN